MCCCRRATNVSVLTATTGPYTSVARARPTSALAAGDALAQDMNARNRDCGLGVQNDSAVLDVSPAPQWTRHGRLRHPYGVASPLGKVCCRGDREPCLVLYRSSCVECAHLNDTGRGEGRQVQRPIVHPVSHLVEMCFVTTGARTQAACPRGLTAADPISDQTHLKMAAAGRICRDHGLCRRWWLDR
jgi:hypothetical protein